MNPAEALKILCIQEITLGDGIAFVLKIEHEDNQDTESTTKMSTRLRDRMSMIASAERNEHLWADKFVS